MDHRGVVDSTEDVERGEREASWVEDDRLSRVLDAATTGLEKVVDSYVDKGEANPEANWKELISGIEVGVLKAVVESVPLDKDDKDGVPIEVLILCGAAERLDGVELVA